MMVDCNEVECEILPSNNQTSFCIAREQATISMAQSAHDEIYCNDDTIIDAMIIFLCPTSYSKNLRQQQSFFIVVLH
jgi:hypothetical protein